MVDYAGEREECDAAALEVRVMRAVDGYVAQSRREKDSGDALSRS
jgi:hypothetical protein